MPATIIWGLPSQKPLENTATTGWGKALEKLPLFTKAEMKKHVENSGKRIGNAEHHSVPTSLKRAKTVLQEEYLKEIETSVDEDYFYFKCKCYHSYKKHEAPHTIQVALCIISGQVIDATCTFAAGKVGYCNHTLALMLKICKYALFKAKQLKTSKTNPMKIHLWHAPQSYRVGTREVGVIQSIHNLLWML